MRRVPWDRGEANGTVGCMPCRDRCRQEDTIGGMLPIGCHWDWLPISVITVTVAPLYDRAHEGGGAEA